MSAIGKGVTLIAGSQLDNLSPITIPAFNKLVFSHYVGRKAWEVIVTDQNGGFVITKVTQTLGVRPAPDTVEIFNEEAVERQRFISIRWEENSVETDAVATGSSSVVITQPQG